LIIDITRQITLDTTILTTSTTSTTDIELDHVPKTELLIIIVLKPKAGLYTDIMKFYAKMK